MGYDLPQAGPSAPVSPYIGPSQAGYGTATGPGANAVIATLTPGAGWYELRVTAGYGGVAGPIDNMDLRIAGTTLTKLIVHAAVNGAPVPARFPRVQVAAGQAVTVNQVGADAAGVYRAQIVATPVP